MNKQNIKPDYKGFYERYEALKNAGCPMDKQELIKLAKTYKCPIPHMTKEGIEWIPTQ